MIEALKHELDKRIALALLLVVSVCSSCISVHGLTDGYDKLSPANKERVVRYDGLKDGEGVEARPSKNIYLVTADELSQIIDRSDKAFQIVYEYNPGCPSDVCIPIASFVSICEKYGAEPIVLARYLDDTLFDLYVPDVPIYGIDHSKYKPNYVYKYVPLYLTDLTGVEMKDDGSGNLFVFEKGSFATRTDVQKIDSWFAE